MEGQKCDKCKEGARAFGPGYQLCNAHYDKKAKRDHAVGVKRTKREGRVAQTCPRRYEMFQRGGPEGQDEWRYARTNDYRTCSYCGSRTPDDFMAQVRAGAEIEPTDKNYKAYLPDHSKFYYQHLSDEQRCDFVDLFNSGSVKTRWTDWGSMESSPPHETVEGRRYWNGALPFFMYRAEKPSCGPTDG